MGFYTVLLVIHSILVLFLIMMVLIQRTDSDGMGGLGGGGGNQFMTGRATANLLTRTTALLAAAFMITSLVLAVVASRMGEGSIIDSVQTEEPAPATLPKDKAPEESKKKPVKSEKTDKTDKTDKQGESAPAVPKPE
jgi:preprotein translocase subunit SecG